MSLGLVRQKPRIRILQGGREFVSGDMVPAHSGQEEHAERHKEQNSALENLTTCRKDES